MVRLPRTVSSSAGLAAMETLAKQNMMPGMTYSWTGLTLDEIESSVSPVS